MADAGTGGTAATSTTTSKLFVRQSSGLVRNVSVTNALFFNVAAFVGVGLTLYPIFYSLAFVPVWRWGPFSEYGWAAIIAGLFSSSHLRARERNSASSRVSLRSIAFTLTPFLQRRF